MKENEIVNSANTDDLYVKLRRQGMSEQKVKDVITQIERDTNDALSQMSPADELKIDEYLDKRRREYGIIDGAFNVMPPDDRVFVYQLPRVEGDTFTKGGIILMTDETKAAERSQSFRGILCKWGLKAKDELRPYDFYLGDIVEFVDMAPWKKLIGMVGGVARYVLVLRAGHMVGNQDAERRRRSGETKYGVDIVRVKETNQVLLQHCIVKQPENPDYPFSDGPMLIAKQQPTVLEEF
jgi:co-chaperonin GroES (HSP10)